MKILVTGGAGYIGSFMAKRLLDERHEVVVVDSFERGYEGAVDKRAIRMVGNLLNTPFVEEVFRQHTFDGVLHFAGYISMAESMERPGMYFTNNMLGAVNVLEAMVKHNVHNFIFSSTAGVYGNPVKIPIPEDHPKNPTNPYGESKLMVERILSWYRRIHGIRFVALRYFNAAGAFLDGSMGELHNPETHIIPNAIHAALGNSAFQLYGTDYNTQDGTCVRDYIHVIDLVEAHVLALNQLFQVDDGLYYNVGTGSGYTNREVLDMVKEISGIEFKIEMRERRPGDAEVLIADCTKIKSECGFIPKYSDLETIVRTAWEWHKKNV